jgi:hypothetical protein
MAEAGGFMAEPSSPVRGLLGTGTAPVRLYQWPHRLLYIGPGHEARMHRHHAAQLCWGLGERLRLRVGVQQGWSEHTGFCVLPDQPHALDASGATVAMMYLESEAAEFAALRTRLGCGASAMRASRSGGCESAPSNPSHEAQIELTSSTEPPPVARGPRLVSECVVATP